MCGIAGVIGTWAPDVARQAAVAMIASIAHRGPDGCALVEIPGAGGGSHMVLAHARLSILDLSDAAAQPMPHDATASWLIYNGELYNHRELRVELTARGHQFRSTGDSEVLLRALVEWGEDAMPRLNGMYAFAFWDGRANRLLLARDPLGIKPLVFTRTSHGVLFASEVRAIAASGLVDVTLSAGAVRSFLTYGAVIEPETICEDVQIVPPGHVVHVSPTGQLTRPRDLFGLDRILELERHRDRADLGAAASTELVEDALQDAVGRHLISDARLGVLLSGGVDSSLLASLASQAAGERLELVTVDFEEQEFSESKFASEVAKRLPGRHLTFKLSAGDLAEMVPAALEAMDQPTVDGINTFVVSSVAAKAGIRVLLSGLGGDELFGGYTTFQRLPLLARAGGLLSVIGPLFERLNPSREVQWSKLGHARRVTVLRDAYLLQRSIHWGPAHPAMPTLEGPPGRHQMPPETWEGLARAAEHDSFHEIAFLEMSFYMRNQLLRDADVFSSAVAIEMRVPYLDLDVVRAAWAVPRRHHQAYGRGKLITRGLLERRLPGLARRRKKMGFTFPWAQWLRGPLGSLVGDVLNSRDAYHPLGLEFGNGRLLLDRFKKKEGLVSWYHVWSLFVLLQWQARRTAPA